MGRFKKRKGKCDGSPAAHTHDTEANSCSKGSELAVPCRAMHARMHTHHAFCTWHATPRHDKSPATRIYMRICLPARWCMCIYVRAGIHTCTCPGVCACVNAYTQHIRLPACMRNAASTCKFTHPTQHEESARGLQSQRGTRQLVM